MKKSLAISIMAISIALSGAVVSSPAHALHDVSTVSALSTLPIASVVVGASAAAGAVVAIPVALSTTGAVLVVETVQSTARGTILVMERASDGARASVEIVGSGIVAASLAAGAIVTVSVIGAGVVLSVAGEAIAFIANGLGQALLHNEQLTY